MSFREDAHGEAALLGGIAALRVGSDTSEQAICKHSVLA